MLITLKSSDNESFVVGVKVAQLSTTLKKLIDDGCALTAVPLCDVTGNILSKVIQYCEKHTEAFVESLNDWDKEFVNVDQPTLFDLVLAANYLDIKDLRDLTCQSVADMIN